MSSIDFSASIEGTNALCNHKHFATNFFFIFL